MRLFDTIIKSKKEELFSLKSGIQKSPQFTDEPKADSETNSTENLNIKIIDKAREIENEISRLYDERSEVVSLIDRLQDPLESTVLRLFYVNGMTWADISREMHGHPKPTKKLDDPGYKSNIHLFPKYPF
ncbi:DUF1492 domain-containing protein [Streptococcus uberis]|nr:DUF1492 domain-containing protein [Streptococcus uberis]MCK1202973.1 DUF1492 domain-containing protein [Streptococcus uberis]